ncbi:rab15 effector protein [Astyanax mexicanus]|uniref:Rab15 effector protein n=2 Tax=Astyanax mexicanus TaxID=7994 RepID=A0A8T2LKG3_ASTMX|nr:rab15 effector protein [Astyanax mexicanus]KAG9271980.1 rab15 effector protein [Astyanax mexicanus]
MNQSENQPKTKPGIFKSLWSSSSNSSLTSCCSLFSDCIRAASTRTSEYLLFSDPKNKFQPSPAALCEIFLMTYIQRSNQLNLTETIHCTVMTREQRLVLGADWVWALLDSSSKKEPRVQIAVQVLHPPEKMKENVEERSSDAYKEILRTAGMEPMEKTGAERMVEFCSAIGKTCFALFLFFGVKKDPANIYGLLSNNLHVAVGKCVQIDQAFIENFFRGAKHYVSPAAMLQTVLNKQDNEPLTMLVKFNI